MRHASQKHLGNNHVLCIEDVEDNAMRLSTKMRDLRIVSKAMLESLISEMMFEANLLRS